MNRNELQFLSKIRLKEVKAMLKAKQFSGAYYLAGYIIECALKACIAKNRKRHEVPDKNYIQDFYTHDFKKLIRLANLESALNEHLVTNSEFAKNWNISTDWKESSRYKPQEELNAKGLFNAINSRNGVLPWLKKHW